MATFGITTTGGSTSALVTLSYFMRAQMGSVGGSCSSISWYMGSSAGSNVKMALYADSGTAPTTVLGNGTLAINTTTEFKTLTFSSPINLVANTWYWFAVQAETATTNVYYRTTTSTLAWRTGDNYSTFPIDNPTLNTSYTVRGYAAYGTYTTSTNGLLSMIF